METIVSINGGTMWRWQARNALPHAGKFCLKMKRRSSPETEAAGKARRGQMPQILETIVSRNGGMS